MVRLAICAHFTYHDSIYSSREYDLLIKYVRDLGFNYVRFDLWWSDIEPDPGSLSLEAIEFYLSILKKLLVNGIKPLVILGTGIPKWLKKKHYTLLDEKYYAILKDKYGLKPWLTRLKYDSVYSKLLEYSIIASSITAKYTEWFQLGNELNNPLISRDLLKLYDPISYITTIYIGLNKTYRLNKRDKPKTILNLFTCLPNWPKYLDKILPRLHKIINVIGVDHYPGTWCSCYNPCNWRVLDKAYSIARKYGLGIAITETGYPTGGLGVCGPKQGIGNQVEYINKFFNTITRHYIDKLGFITWYELIDEQHTLLNKTTYEGYFGVVNRDLEPKKSYYILQKWIKYIKQYKPRSYEEEIKYYHAIGKKEWKM